MEQDLIVVTSVLGSSVGVLLIAVLVLFCQVVRVRRELRDLQARPAIRVQKLTLDPREGHHAFQNPAIVPDEELSKRGYSMYVGDDVESQRGTERQTGGQFVEELAKELESRHQRQEAPPFLLQSIEDKRRTRDFANPNNPLANQNPQNNNQSRSRDQNYELQNRFENVPHSRDQNYPLPHKNGVQSSNSQVVRQKQSMVPEDDRVNRQNSFLYNQNSQNSKAKKNNVRQSDTNPNFIY